MAWFDLAALGQVWLFLLAPVVGAALAGATYALVTGVDRRGTEIDGDGPGRLTRLSARGPRVAHDDRTGRRHVGRHRDVMRSAPWPTAANV